MFMNFGSTWSFLETYAKEIILNTWKTLCMKMFTAALHDYKKKGNKKCPLG